MIESDSQAQALLFALTLPILSSNFTIEEGPEDSGEAEFAREVFLQGQHQGGMKTPIHAVLAQMAEAQAIKRSYFEIVWRVREDGHQVIDKLAWRPPRTCDVLVDEKGAVEGFYQEAVTRDGKPIMEYFRKDKAFIYIHQSQRRPIEGISSFQTAYADWQEKLKVNRLHNMHLQNFALPKVIGKYTGRAQDGAKRLFNKLRKFSKGVGGSIVMNQAEGEGAGEEMEYMSVVGAGTEFLDKISFINTQMAGSVLLRFLMLGTESNTGAWALTRDHSDFFLMGQETVQKDIASEFTNGPVAAMTRLNFGEGASFPQAAFAPLSESQQKATLDVWTKLVAAPNKPEAEVWQAIEDIAVRFLGVDIDKIREETPAEGEEPTEELPGAGNADALMKSIEQVVKRAGTQPNGQPATSSNSNGGTPNIRGANGTPPRGG